MFESIRVKAGYPVGTVDVPTSASSYAVKPIENAFLSEVLPDSAFIGNVTTPEGSMMIQLNDRRPQYRYHWKRLSFDITDPNVGVFITTKPFLPFYVNQMQFSDVDVITAQSIFCSLAYTPYNIEKVIQSQIQIVTSAFSDQAIFPPGYGMDELFLKPDRYFIAIPDAPFTTQVDAAQSGTWQPPYVYGLEIPY